MEKERINKIDLHKSVSINRTPEVEYEYNTAVSDLLEDNFFKLSLGDKKNTGPYELLLSIVENRLIIDITDSSDTQKKEHITIPITPFRRVIKDYFFICESYYKAVKDSTAQQIETIDMARRSLHNEGADTLRDLLDPQIDTDMETSRRLFTLICVLHIK